MCARHKCARPSSSSTGETTASTSARRQAAGQLAISTINGLKHANRADKDMADASRSAAARVSTHAFAHRMDRAPCGRLASICNGPLRDYVWQKSSRAVPLISSLGSGRLYLGCWRLCGG